jgi:hypothetical protein
VELRMNTSVARRSLAFGCGLVLLTPGTGCRKTGAAAQELTQAPTMESATGEAKCGVRKSAAKPLVVEWPAADRAALEARTSRGLVAVRYSGCEMEVLTNCTAAGAYEYLSLTQKREGVKITNADELYAQLPVGAAGLEAKLERSGQLNVDMVIVGRQEADKSQFTERDLEGRCSEATHVITGLTVGAFSFYSGAGAEVGAGVKVGNVGAGASSSAGQEILKSDGDESSCAVSSAGDTSPPEGCGALLRVEVVPVDRMFAGAAAATSSSDPRPASSATGSDQDPRAAPVDPEIDKKLRVAKALTYTGYIGALGGLGLLGGGFAVYNSNKKKLEAEQTGDTVSSDRQSNISKARTGLALLYAGLGVTVVGTGLLVYGSIRSRNLQAQKAASRAHVQPLFGPGLAGLGVSGRF